MGSSRLVELSTDLKSLVVSFIIRPTDLVNVCLTCKQFHEIAVRFLYHTIILDLGSEADKRIPAMLNPRNKGLQHVRNIELYRADLVDTCGVMRQADLAMRMLLEFLPENQLERWSFHPWSSFSADNMKLLYKKQKNMKWLEAIALDRKLCSCLINQLDLDSVSQHVTKLGLYPESRDTLQFAHELLKRTPKVTKITLHTNFDGEEVESPVPPSELNDSPTEYGLLTRTIFGHMMPFGKCKPLCLTDLTLQRVHLRYATRTFCRAIDFRHIRNLRISECSGADALLAGLCESAHLPKRLITFELKHDDDGRDCESMTAMEGFLCLTSGVQRLTIDMGNTKGLPNESCITRHHKTLKILNVHSSPVKSTDSEDEDEWVYENEAFDKICKACRQLEQLCVAFPRTPVARMASDDYVAFSASLRYLYKLVTLNITTWPTAGANTSRMPRKLYEQLLHGLAQAFIESVFQTTAVPWMLPWTPSASATNAPPQSSIGHSTEMALHSSVPTPAPLSISSANSHVNNRPATVRSKLNVVAFGTSDKIHEREDSKNIIIFVRSRQVDPLGRGESVLAVPIGWCLRKYVEPRSEVLDFGLMRSTRPPVIRDLGSSDDGDW